MSTEETWDELVSKLLRIALKLDDEQTRKFLRQGALLWVDALERRDGMTPRTAELRQWWKQQRK